MVFPPVEDRSRSDLPAWGTEGCSDDARRTDLPTRGGRADASVSDRYFTDE